MTTLKDNAYTAARDGMAITLFAILCTKDIDQIEAALATLTSENGQHTTPLIIACKNGHLPVVKTIIGHFNVDLEQAGTMKFDGYTIEGATALWCAAGSGNMKIVEVLVEAGADVNHSTKTNSTPLRAACFDGRLDIVKYLVQHQADISIANKYKNTCVMISAYKGHQQVVEYLLEQGADPNAVAHCGAMALHFSAENGNVDITSTLLRFNAKMTTNDHGMTPLMLAAENGQADVVEFFIKSPETSLTEQIEALELLGASYGNDKDNYDVQKAYSYLWLAQHMRQNDLDVLEKKVLDPIEAYGNRTECATVNELEKIQNNSDEIHNECLMVRERILGRDNLEIAHPIIFRGAVYADSAQFDKCIVLWKHAMQLRFNQGRPIAVDVLRFTQVFSQMFRVGIEVKFNDLLKVFSLTIEDMRRSKDKVDTSPAVGVGPSLTDTFSCTSVESNKHDSKEQLESLLHISLSLIVLISKLSWTRTQDFKVCSLIYQLTKLNLTLSNGQTLLHMAVDYKTKVDDFHVNEIVKFPNAKVVVLLLSCGANPNALTNFHETSLHLIVMYNRPVSDFFTLHNIIMKLEEHGCHIDRTNKNGKTASEISTTGVAELIIRILHRPTLKCMSAKVIQKHNLCYKGNVPASLEEFIAMH